MKIGDKIIQIHTGEVGYIITKPVKLFDDIQVGIKFNNKKLNSIFDPYYCSIYTLKVVND